METQSNFSRFIKTYLPTVISLAALVVSILAYHTANTTLKYNISKDRLWDTPALVDISDSTEIKFKTNKDIAQLQSISIIFPDEVSNRNFEAFSKPLSFPKENLELLVKNYLSDVIPAKDSIICVGTFSLPVMIDYNAIVGSENCFLRENRFLIFDVFKSNEENSVKYNSSVLISRPSFEKYDETNLGREDVKKFLSKQLSLLLENVRVEKVKAAGKRTTID